MSASARRERLADLRPRHCTEADCACEQWRWNGASAVLRGDPPSTCTCGHLTSHHSFLPRASAADLTGVPS